MKRLPILLTALLVGGAVLIPSTTASADYTPDFIRLTDELPGFNTPTLQQLADLAQRQEDPNNLSENNPDGVTSINTYFGQFLDHDLTLDTSPPPTAPVDPTTLINNRTFALDLDSVYGGGPSVSPQLYSGDKFLIQEPNPNGVRDLPRNPDGSAILVEKRNDENQVLAQIHVAFLKAHNRLIDQGLSFEAARTKLAHHYRLAVSQDYLVDVLTPVPAKVVEKIDPKKKGTYIEFSVAAFRFGHSQVRLAYRLNGTNNCQNLQVFSLTAPAASLMGGRQIQAGRQIDWGMFVEELPQPEGCAGVQPRNISRKIDTLISASLFRLPIPGAEATGSNVLAFRNMLRAKFYDLPSGQDMAEYLGIPVITPEELNLGPGFESGTPLWFYVLAESERAGGAKLGPTGSAIVNASFTGALENGEKLTGKGTTDPAIVGPDGVMQVADLLVFAGVASR